MFVSSRVVVVVNLGYRLEPGLGLVTFITCYKGQKQIT
jgi:hypothetical protein